MGTVRKNKREISQDFLPQKSRAAKLSLFGFQKDATLVSNSPKKSKTVLLLSTLCFDDGIDDTTGADHKPEMMTFYNMTKVGVDLVDHLCQKNNIARNTRRWPMMLFYNFLNIAAINALCIFKYHASTTNKTVKKVDFIENISWELIKLQIERLSNLESLSTEIRKRSKLLLGNLPEPAQQSEKSNGSRGRCYLCERARNKSTRRWCNTCKNWACVNHLKDVCVTCTA